MFFMFNAQVPFSHILLKESINHPMDDGFRAWRMAQSVKGFKKVKKARKLNKFKKLKELKEVKG